MSGRYADLIGYGYGYGDTYIGQGEPAAPPAGAMAPHGPFPMYGPQWGGPFAPYGYWNGPGFPTDLSGEIQENRYPSLTLGPASNAIAQRSPCPFEMKWVEPGETVTVRATPQVPGKLVGAVFGRKITNEFVILDFTVGIMPVLAGKDGAVPLEYFAPDSFHSNLNSWTALPNQPIIMQVKNIGCAGLCFAGSCVLENLSGAWAHLYGKIANK